MNMSNTLNSNNDPDAATLNSPFLNLPINTVGVTSVAGISTFNTETVINNTETKSPEETILQQIQVMLKQQKQQQQYYHQQQQLLHDSMISHTRVVHSDAINSHTHEHGSDLDLLQSCDLSDHESEYFADSLSQCHVSIDNLTYSTNSGHSVGCSTSGSDTFVSEEPDSITHFRTSVGEIRVDKETPKILMCDYVSHTLKNTTTELQKNIHDMMNIVIGTAATMMERADVTEKDLTTTQASNVALSAQVAKCEAEASKNFAGGDILLETTQYIPVPSFNRVFMRKWLYRQFHPGATLYAAWVYDACLVIPHCYLKL
jgi:hypothetical protein